MAAWGGGVGDELRRESPLSHGEWKGWSEGQEGLPAPLHLLFYPDPEPESETPTPQIPEAPTPDVPVWNIRAFTLLDGRLVLLGGEEEVRRGPWARRGNAGKGRGNSRKLPASSF